MDEHRFAVVMKELRQSINKINEEHFSKMMTIISENQKQMNTLFEQCLTVLDDGDPDDDFNCDDSDVPSGSETTDFQKRTLALQQQFAQTFESHQQTNQFLTSEIQTSETGNSNLYRNLNCNPKLEFPTFEVSTTIASEMFDQSPKKEKLEVDDTDVLSGLELVSDDTDVIVLEEDIESAEPKNRNIHQIAPELFDEYPKKNSDLLLEVKKVGSSHEWGNDCTVDDYVHDTCKVDLAGTDLVYDSRIVLTFGSFPRVKLKFNVLFAHKITTDLKIIIKYSIHGPVDHKLVDISLSSAQSESNLVSDIVNQPSDVALFLHTSGTTSRPKGVPLTQLNLASSVHNIKSVYKLTESDSTVLVLPLFHVHGLIAGLLSSLVAGGAVTLPSTGRFSESTIWSDMIRYNATWYTAVPTIHQIILDCHSFKPEPEYPKLRFIRSCSASLAPSILERLEKAFGAPVLEAYAMTEATYVMSSNPLPDNGPHNPGSVGKPVGQEMAILDESGVEQEAGAKGEVCIRGPNVTKGYKNNPEANKTGFQFGWFHTGDIGYLDSNGYLHLVGRIKELINRGGEKISPIEVDSVLLSHPDIAQAVCFGVPDDKYGEEINCAVIPKEGSDIDEAGVLSFCKKNLAAFKVPKKVFITDTVPKTATGKIQRRIVAEHFLSHISTAKVPKFGA